MTLKMVLVCTSLALGEFRSLKFTSVEALDVEARIRTRQPALEALTARTSAVTKDRVLDKPGMNRIVGFELS